MEKEFIKMKKWEVSIEALGRAELIDLEAMKAKINEAKDDLMPTF